MGHMIDAAYDRVFGTEVVRELPPMATRAADSDPANQKATRERLKVKLIVMSRFTERELMREDFNNSTGICSPRISGEPARIFNVRIAYDDSLSDGQFLVCGDVY